MGRKQVFSSSMLPPSELTYQSHVPPWRLPPMMLFNRIIDLFDCGGISGTKSDSRTPMPPPTGEELRQTVTWTSFSSPSASWKRPPPPRAAVLPEIVVFSIRVSPSERL